MTLITIMKLVEKLTTHVEYEIQSESTTHGDTNQDEDKTKTERPLLS